MSTRIYLVKTKEGASRLVRAASASQAVRHCAKQFSAEVATQNDLVGAIGAGTLVEDAGEEVQS